VYGQVFVLQIKHHTRICYLSLFFQLEIQQYLNDILVVYNVALYLQMPRRKKVKNNFLRYNRERHHKSGSSTMMASPPSSCTPSPNRASDPEVQSSLENDLPGGPCESSNLSTSSKVSVKKRKLEDVDENAKQNKNKVKTSF
jgi:hypothetical protein